MRQGFAVDAVGKRLRTERERQGLSQREIATDGVSYSYISRVESGQRDPSMQALVALAARLGTTAERLVYGDEPPERCPFCGRADTAGGGAS